VHCEANSAVSFWLAGLFLKVSLFGFIRFFFAWFRIGWMFMMALWLGLAVLTFCLVGMIGFRFYEVKKIIAFASVGHMNYG